MALEILWGNLATVAFPFIIALGVSIGLAFGLRQAARTSGLPRARETCVDCVHERGLLRLGRCEQNCAVNELPALPLILFVACSTFVLLAAFFPGVVETYVVPLTPEASPAGPVLLLVLLASAAAGSVTLAAYFLQDLPRHRELLLWGSAFVAMVSLLVGTVAVGIVGLAAEGLAAAGLSVMIVAMALEWRARQGRPAVGLRAVGAAVVPLFVIAILAAVRIGQILQLASQS